MQKFRSTDGATFDYDLDFAEFDYANISFFDAEHKDILFHLSLRRTAGLAVINTRRTGQWQAERRRDTAFVPAGDKVSIRFGAGRVQVLLNGAGVFDLAEEDLPGLETIAGVNFQGALVPGSILLGGPGNSPRKTFGALDFDGPLSVVGWAADPALHDQDLSLAIVGQDEPIRVVRLPRPDLAARHGVAVPDIGLRVDLPGRIWCAADAAGEVRLQACNNGLHCGAPLVLRRDDLPDRIESLVAGAGPETDAFTLMQTLEHARFGDVWGRLSPETRARLAGAAHTLGLDRFLAPVRPQTAADIGPDIGPLADTMATEQALLFTLRRAFGAGLDQIRTGARSDRPIDILAALLEQTTLTPRAQRDLYLSLTDAFCQAGCFEDLYAHAQSHDLHRYSRGDTNWHNSVILPFLCHEGRLLEVRALIHKLAESDDSGWFATPAIAATVRAVLAMPRTPANEQDIENLLRAFLFFVIRRSHGYWDRAPCVALIGTILTLLEHIDSLPDYMITMVVEATLTAYGLSPTYWAGLARAVAEGRIDPPGPLREGARAFALLTADRPGAFEAGLAFFDDWKVAGLARLRIERIGAGAVDLTTRLPGRQARGQEPDEGAVLRALAFPGRGDRPGDKALYPLSRAAIRTRHNEAPKSEYYRLQGDTSRAATAFLAAAGTAPHSDAQLDRILAAMGTLAAPRNGFLGIGMMLGLYDGLTRLGADPAAQRVLARLAGLRADIPKENQIGLFRAPAIRSALLVLALRRDDPAVRAALALFPHFDPAEAPQPPVDPVARRTGIWDVAAPLFSTLVVVFSCRANLDGRVAAMRNGWLAGLADLGIPYVVVTGGGHGQREDDVVRLNAPDDYEGLPQKTLEAVRWVYRNTACTHMLKIDDDCFLDVPEFFQSQSHRKFDYYGRRLFRKPGETDRMWHMDKSTSARGRLELDKSPEPSEYADGGSGYVLSRHAMGALLDAAASAPGAALVNVSFMEDKMVGDLLALCDIRVAEEDFLVSIRRRTRPDGVPTPMWLNSFFAGPASGVKQVHLDTATDQALALKRAGQGGLWPKKLWPTFAPVRLGYQSGALELISNEARLTRVNAEPLAVVACMRNEMFMLPHFLTHYRKLGVRAFLVIDNRSDDGTLEHLLAQPDVAVFSVDTDYRLSQYGVAWQMAVVANLRVNRWSLMADADELLVYRGWKRKALPKLLRKPALRDADAVRLRMLDMYPRGPLRAATFAKGGPFAEADHVDARPFLRDTVSRGPFSNAETLTSALRHRLLPGARPDIFVAQKFALLKYRPWMRVSAGLHYLAEAKLADQEMLFAHFKYNAHFRAKAVEEVARGQHFNDAEEYRKYLDLMAEGREVIFDPAVSVHWDHCEDVRRILD